MFHRSGIATVLPTLLLASLLSACGGSSDPAPAGLSYSRNPAVYALRVPIGPNSPSSTGGPVTLYSVDRALPDGLLLDQATGVITGTPTAPAARTVYTVTAWSSAGSTSTALTLGVPGFVPTGRMTETRHDSTTTLLATGKVLVAGQGGPGPASGNLYDVATGRFTATGSMAGENFGHSASLLRNGKVLIAGGDPAAFTRAELYDPATGLFRDTGSMTADRANPTATLLANGKVLMVGGVRDAGLAACAELYDPDTGLFTATGNTARNRYAPSATLLPSGKVLVAGGEDPVSIGAELFDPVTGTFATTGSMTTARQGAAAVLLPNGKVLVAGGGGTNGPGSAELYDPASGTFMGTGGMAVDRFRPSATLLPSGRVLVAGGFVMDPAGALLTSAEIYDPATGTFSSAGTMAYGRAGNFAALLPTGSVLVAGGDTSIAELYLE